MIQLRFKNNAVFESAFEVAWHDKLIGLCSWLNGLPFEKIFTCLYEKRDYLSVHSTDPLRGFDLRSRVIADPAIIRDMVNRYWVYDPDRPEKRCCIYHDTGRGIHLHFQVFDNTVYNGQQQVL